MDSTTFPCDGEKPRFSESPPVPCSVPVGWQCPRCGRVNAPWAMQCTCAAATSPDQWPGEPRKWPTYTGDPLPGQEPTTVCSTPNAPREGRAVARTLDADVRNSGGSNA